VNICLLTKKEKPGVKEAIVLIKNMTKNIDVFYGDTTDSFPESVAIDNYDIIISYISPWIIPKIVLQKTKKWNINFHPGPPEYPGIGCFNFAIFDSAQQFGATAHVMDATVDTGKIIGVKRFSISENETVESLSVKTYKAQLALFKKIIQYIFSYDRLPRCDEKWRRKPFKRSELEKLANIYPNMSKKEIEERIRATYFPGKPAPFIELYGHRFEYNPDR